MTADNEILLNFAAPHGGYSLAFEDDGKVAYAYLKQQCQVVGDVWIYNRCPTPEVPEWSDRTKAPFANPRGYALEGGEIRQALRIEDIQVDWDYEANGPVAYVYLFGDLYAVLGVGDKPGYARLAVADGPLAKVMETE